MLNKIDIHEYSEQELKKVLRFMDGPLRIALKENVAVANKADIKEGNVVLDLGCGSGFITLEVAKRVGDKGKVIGCDLRRGMLEVLQNKAKKLGLDQRISVIQADAAQLSFADNSFDAVTMSYLIHENKEDPMTIMKEAVRVLKPNGKLVISDFIKVDDPIRNQEIEDWYKETDPESEKDEIHFYFSLKDYEELFMNAGLKDVKSEIWYEFQGIIEGRK